MSTALPAGTRRVRLSEGNWIVNAAGELCGRVTDGGEVVLLPRYSTDTSGNVTGLVGPDGTQTESFQFEPIDPRDWSGFDNTGTHDMTAIAQAVADASRYNGLGSGLCYEAVWPSGQYILSAGITGGQSMAFRGGGGYDKGTVFLFYGGASENCFTFGDDDTEVSFVTMEKIRIVDMRTNPTAGSGLYFNRVVNGTFLERMFVKDFPDSQIYFGASSSHAADNFYLGKSWVSASKAGSWGVFIEYVNNNITLDQIYSDQSGGTIADVTLGSGVNGASGGAIGIGTNTAHNSLINIRQLKHEPTDSTTPSVVILTASHGSISLDGILQRPQGSADGCDVVRIIASSNDQVTLRNIDGSNHTSWPNGAAGRATVRAVDNGGAYVCGHVAELRIGATGRMHRRISGNGNPTTTGIYGNVGDIYTRLDATAGVPALYLKKFGTATNTGWSHFITDADNIVSVTYSASIQQDMRDGLNFGVATLTGNVSVLAVTNPTATKKFKYTFVQDGTGGRTVTWNAAFKGVTLAASGSANQKAIIEFYHDGTDAIQVWTSGWYT